MNVAIQALEERLAAIRKTKEEIGERGELLSREHLHRCEAHDRACSAFALESRALKLAHAKATDEAAQVLLALTTLRAAAQGVPAGSVPKGEGGVKNFDPPTAQDRPAVLR